VAVSIGEGAEVGWTDISVGTTAKGDAGTFVRVASGGVNVIVEPLGTVGAGALEAALPHADATAAIKAIAVSRSTR
jgi:hypothetical protein